MITVLEATKDGNLYRWMKTENGSAHMYIQCCKCQDFFLASDCAFDRTGLCCCLTCRSGVDLKAKPVFKLDVPPAYTFADLTQIEPSARRTMLSAWPSKSPFLIILGAIGRGKTHAAWALAKHMAQSGRHVKLLDCKDIRAEYISSLSENRARMLQYWSDCSNLILDSVADVPATEGWKQAVFTVLDRRWNQQRPTVVITKAAGEDFEHLYGADVRSRLNQYKIVSFDGVDKRKKLEGAK